MADYDLGKEIKESLMVKLPFSIFGIFVGMLAVYVAFRWVPKVFQAAVTAFVN